jgi:hypothetical protein
MRKPSDTPASDDRPDRGQRSSSRDARLKTALKANMARRKAQAKARDAEKAPGDTKGKD